MIGFNGSSSLMPTPDLQDHLSPLVQEHLFDNLLLDETKESALGRISGT